MKMTLLVRKMGLYRIESVNSRKVILILLLVEYSHLKAGNGLPTVCQQIER